MYYTSYTAETPVASNSVPSIKRQKFGRKVCAIYHSAQTPLSLTLAFSHESGLDHGLNFL